MYGSVVQAPRHPHLFLFLVAVFIALLLLLVAGDTPALSSLLM